MIAFFCFLVSLLWGCYLGGYVHRGNPTTKTHLPSASSIGILLFTIPVASLLITQPHSKNSLAVVGILSGAGLLIGLCVGIRSYWID